MVVRKQTTKEEYKHLMILSPVDASGKQPKLEGVAALRDAARAVAVAASTSLVKAPEENLRVVDIVIPNAAIFVLITISAEST